MRRALLICLSIILLAFLWYKESRTFYNIEDNNCITVWKYNNRYYIIPGKYYGLLKPTVNFLESPVENYITIYYSKELPNSLVFRSERDIKVINNKKDSFLFLNYNENIAKFDKLLYLPAATKNNDIKPNVYLLDIFLKENFAINKDGKKL